ncbi:hypothetical protein GQ53DRAFT_777676 [Thozetella sp. PMI_491]|nr:hypothetical protein GQ53DRAFT_777676 [Thozetella sp. PMI_491]
MTEVRLSQVDDKTETETDIDIIAIHGLDTKSPDTWTWKDPGDPKNKAKWVNWLQHPDMLPKAAARARIFTCDWAADLLQPSDLVQKRIEEHALLLLNGIQRDIATNGTRQEDRPVFFIASCLGGILLIKALVLASDKSEYSDLIRATRGIVFLATPFRGTSFQDVAAWARPGLSAWAWTRHQEPSKLLDSVERPTYDLDTLVHCYVFNFYELGKTSLPSKLFPWLPTWCRLEKPLVDRSSATLDMVPQPLPLNRPHVLTNKFCSPKCPEYNKVAVKIEKILGRIREGTLLMQADDWIRRECYNKERLMIERLSSAPLPMEQCYINLALIAHARENIERSAEASDGNTVPQASPFSLQARLKVEEPVKMQVELPTIFDSRKGRDGNTIQPRRILIRGRAGVGKTTLCKKIIYEFTRGTWSQWNDLFDRILWVPLRKLKGRPALGYNFEALFHHEYFSRPKDRTDLAKALSDALAESSRTLFLLDGLDEVSQDLSGECDMSSFLEDLLKQPNVIVTSRPYSKPPDDLHLELETIGFYADQVNEYIRKTVRDPQKIDEIQSFLQQHQLVQDLVRIPIQLDALCFAWNEGINHGTKLDTITAHGGEPVTKAQIQSTSRLKIESFVEDEILFLEGLAFNGMRDDIIEFDTNYIDDAFDQRSALADKTIPCLSFLQTSDPSTEFRNQTCHFLHLTYQEYFGARYWVRQWKAEKDPKSESTNTRFDIFWRFVSGLLDAEGRAEEFFKTIEREPRDLLGPTHQRLIMHCLSEVSTKISQRASLEEKLSHAHLAGEAEFPEQALLNALQDCSDTERPTSSLENQDRDVRCAATYTLGCQSRLPEAVLTAVAARLEDQDDDVRHAAANALGRQSSLPEAVLTAVAARLKDQDNYAVLTAVAARLENKDLNVRVMAAEALGSVAARLEDQNDYVRRAAANALGRQSSLPEAVLIAVAAQLEDQDDYVRRMAATALGRQSSLPKAVLTAVAARLEHQDYYIRRMAATALGRQSSLPEAVLTAVAARLEDQDLHVRHAATYALGRQSSLPEAVLTAVAARLEDQNHNVRSAAADTLGRQSSLPKAVLTAVAARLEDQNDYVRHAAADTLLLQKHEAFYSTLLGSPLLTGSLYIWSWYVEDHQISSVNMPDGTRSAKIDEQEFVNVITKARPRGVPSTEMMDGDRIVALIA